MRYSTFFLRNGSLYYIFNYAPSFPYQFIRIINNDGNMNDFTKYLGSTTFQFNFLSDISQVFVVVHNDLKYNVFFTSILKNSWKCNRGKLHNFQYKNCDYNHNYTMEF